MPSRNPKQKAPSQHSSANQNQTSVYVWDLRETNLLKTLDVGTPVSGISWDYTGQFLAACGTGAVVVNQYAKNNSGGLSVM